MKIITYNDIEEVLNEINQSEKPLAAYYFGNQKGKTKDRLESELFSGMFIVNETVDFEQNYHLHFGGVGSSGTGCFRGLTGYRSFSHPKACLYDFGESVQPKGQPNMQKYMIYIMIAVFLIT